MSKKIFVVGSSNVDFIMKLPRLPKVGESVTNGQFMQTYGGKGANQAVAAARAGGDVWFVNCVGDDEYGSLIRQNLKEVNAHTDFIWTAEGYSSGTAIVLIGEQGKNLPTIDPGANYALTPSMILSIRKEMETTAMLVLQYEMLEETLYATLDIAKELDIPVVFNCAPPHGIDTSKFNGIEYLIVNETEAEFLLGYPVVDTPSMHKATQDLLAFGVATAIITLGENGVFLASQDWHSFVPAFTVDAVDTTGAGDTFCGTLAVALVEGKSILEAVRFANAAASLCVTKLGAQPSIPTRQQIDAFLDEHDRQG
ncbi:MAG: ribokinase [Anaerolineae bacterium]|jgi:ribokinase|nr:ribokinase [Anaerolineae bacterium]